MDNVAVLREAVSLARRRLAPADRGAADLRAAAQALGRSASGNLDEAWARAEGVPEGPIDVIDVFSGCGGMSAGFRALNGLVPSYRIAAAADIDHVANESYVTNLGVRPDPADVHALAKNDDLLHAFTRGRRRRGHPLVLIGCSPCQGFSSHRNQAGTTDARNSLFVDFARIAVKLRPDVVVAENVPELLTDRYWSWVDDARAELEAAGYTTHLSVHDMATFGVPQQRFRALLLAMRRPFVPPAGYLDDSSFKTVRDAIGALPVVAAGERAPDDPLHMSARHRESTLATIRAVPKNGGSRPRDVGPDCLRRVEARQGKAAYEDVYGRLRWDRPAITITHYSRNPASGRFVHPEQDRGLTIREAALLQGFPAQYMFRGTFDDAFRQIGNAVPPVFSAYLAGHLLGELIDDQLPLHTQIVEDVERPVGSSFSRLIPGIKASSMRKAAA